MKVLLLSKPDPATATLSGVHKYFHELVRAMDGSVEYVYVEERGRGSGVRGQEAGGRRQEAGGRGQEAGGRRQLALRSSASEAGRSETSWQPGNEAAVKKRGWLPGDLTLVAGYVRETLALARKLRPFRTRADIIHVVAGGCEISPIAARLAGFGRIVDTVQALHGSDDPAQHWFRRLIERLCFRCSDLKIMVSDAAYEDWQRRVNLHRDGCVTIFNGMEPPDYSGFDRRAYRSRFCDDPDNTVLIGISARLHAMKGHAVLLEAFAQLRSQLSVVSCQLSACPAVLGDRSRSFRVECSEGGSQLATRSSGSEAVRSGCAFHSPQPTVHNQQPILLIAGDGPERANIEKKIAGLGIGDHVRLLGHREDPSFFTASLDLHVLPSLSLETIGYANIEAMFGGVPCVVSDTGGMKEIVLGSGGGRMVPAGDVPALCEAMAYYAANPDARSRDGQKGREFAHRHLTAKAMAEATRRVYERMMDGSAERVWNAECRKWNVGRGT